MAALPGAAAAAFGERSKPRAGNWSRLAAPTGYRLRAWNKMNIFIIDSPHRPVRAKLVRSIRNDLDSSGSVRGAGCIDMKQQVFRTRPTGASSRQAPREVEFRHGGGWRHAIFSRRLSEPDAKPGRFARSRASSRT